MIVLGLPLFGFFQFMFNQFYLTMNICKSTIIHNAIYLFFYTIITGISLVFSKFFPSTFKPQFFFEVDFTGATKLVMSRTRLYFREGSFGVEFLVFCLIESYLQFLKYILVVYGHSYFNFACFLTFFFPCEKSAISQSSITCR